MTDLIPLDAALVSLDSHAHGTTTLGGQTYRSITLEVAVEALQAIPAIDPTAIREAALREAADKLVHVGYPNTDDEADGPVAVILALIQKDNTND